MLNIGSVQKAASIFNRSRTISTSNDANDVYVLYTVKDTFILSASML